MTRQPLGTRAAAALVMLLGWPSGAAADSIQKAGLTTGIAEGFGRTPGVYIATIFDVGFRSTDPSVTKQAVMIPAFAVPSSILLHVLSLRQLSRRTRQATA